MITNPYKGYVESLPIEINLKLEEFLKIKANCFEEGAKAKEAEMLRLAHEDREGAREARLEHGK